MQRSSRRRGGRCDPAQPPGGAIRRRRDSHAGRVKPSAEHGGPVRYRLRAQRDRCTRLRRRIATRDKADHATPQSDGQATRNAASGVSARMEVAISVVFGVAAAVPVIVVGSVPLGLLVGCGLTSLIYIIWLRIMLRPRDAHYT